MSIIEIQKKNLDSLKSVLDKQNYKTQIITDHKPCLKIAIPNTLLTDSKSIIIPDLHYEFIFDEIINLRLSLEIHCEKTMVRDIFWGSSIKNFVDPFEKEYVWFEGKNGKKIIRYKKIIDLRVTGDEKAKSLALDYLQKIRGLFESYLIDFYNKNKSHFEK